MSENRTNEDSNIVDSLLITEKAAGMLSTAAQLIETALYRSKGAAIVHIDGFDQNELAKKIHQHHFVSSTDELLEDQFKYLPPNEPITWIITGYSNRFSKEPETEAKLQNIIRAQWNTRGRENLSLIVLSDSLPDTSFMKSHLPWFNGPFEDNPVYAVTAVGDKVELAHKKLTEVVYKDEGGKAHFKEDWINIDATRV